MATFAVGGAGQLVCSVTNRIKDVAGLGVPAQIVDVVVGWVTVIVAGHRTVGTGADESGQNELVNQPKAIAGVLTQGNHFVTLFVSLKFADASWYETLP